MTFKHYLNDLLKIENHIHIIYSYFYRIMFVVIIEDVIFKHYLSNFLKIEEGESRVHKFIKRIKTAKQIEKAYEEEEETAREEQGST